MSFHWLKSESKPTKGQSTRTVYFVVYYILFIIYSSDFEYITVGGFSSYISWYSMLEYRVLAVSTVHGTCLSISAAICGQDNKLPSELLIIIFNHWKANSPVTIFRADKNPSYLYYSILFTQRFRINFLMGSSLTCALYSLYAIFLLIKSLSMYNTPFKWQKSCHVQYIVQ